MRASRETPEPGRPDLRLWQIVAPALLDNDGVSIEDLPTGKTTSAPMATDPSPRARASPTKRDASQDAGTSTTRPEPDDVVEDYLNALALQVRCETPVHEAPLLPLTASQQRRIAQIAATDWALMIRRSEERALRAFWRDTNSRPGRGSK